jgi:hypothetical protein
MVGYIECGDADMLLAGFRGPGWYFWDETSTRCYGPYSSEEIAVGAWMQYADWLNEVEESDGGKTRSDVS